MVTRRKKDPLRPPTADERAELERVSRAGSDRADRVARAKALLAVADGAWYTHAAEAAGWRLGDTVADLVARFNVVGPAARDPQHGGGPANRYPPPALHPILQHDRPARYLPGAR